MNKSLPLLALIGMTAVSCSDSSNFDATGTFESASEIVVSSESTGKIVAFNVEEGDTLTAGQTIGHIDTTQLYLVKLQLQKNASSIRSNRPDMQKQVAATQKQIEKQKFERERIKRLLADNAATQKQLDDIESSIAILQKQLEAQQSALANNIESLNEQSSSIEVQIASIDDKIQKSIISAPVDGIVLAKYTNANEFATVGKPLFKIADMQNMYLRAYFTSEQIAEIKLGQKVTVTADFGNDKRYDYHGEVVWIASQSEFTPKTIQTADSRASLVYAVKILVKNDGRLKIGTYGEVRL